MFSLLSARTRLSSLVPLGTRHRGRAARGEHPADGNAVLGARGKERERRNIGHISSFSRRGHELRERCFRSWDFHHGLLSLGITLGLGLLPAVTRAASAPEPPAAATPEASSDDPSAPTSDAPADEESDTESDDTESNDTESAGSSEDGSADVDVSGQGLGLFSSGGGEDGAASSDASAVTTAASNPWSFDFNGYVRADAFIGKALDRRMAELKAGYGEVALQIRVKRERFGDAFAETRLRYGHDGEATRLAVDLREAYVNAYLGPVDLRLGHQIIVWGRADGFNPTNQLMPIDLRIRSPLEDDRRLANLGLRMFLNFRPVRIEGVWLPLYSPVRLPAVPLDELIVLNDARMRPDLSKGLGAGRFHLELAKIEMSASYIYGHSPLPGLALQDVTISESTRQVRVTRTPYNQHVAGFDFSTAIGNIMGIRGEIAYRHPLNHRNKVYAARPDLNYVFGLDRDFGPVNIILQYVGTYVFDWAKEAGAAGTPNDTAEEISIETLRTITPDLAASASDLINLAINNELRRTNQILFAQIARHQHSLSTRIQWTTLHDTLSFSALGMFNITTFEWLLYPKIEYRLSDRMLMSLGGEVYSGPPGTRFDWIDGLLSAGYLEMKFFY